jgi:glycosyltransferase involved in cell wall biosynthesis
MNEPKIFFGLSGFFPEHTAGTETYVLNLAKELRKLNYRVSVVIPAPGKKSENYKYDEIDVFSFSVPLKVTTGELNGFGDVSGIEEFSKILDTVKPDIFHLHSFSRSLHAAHIKKAKEKGIHTAFTAHLGGTFCINGDLQLFGNRICDGKADKNRCLACFIKKNKKITAFPAKSIALFINFLLDTQLKFRFPAFNIAKNKTEQLKILNQFSDRNIAIAPWLEKVFKINNIQNVFLVNQGIDSDFIKLSEMKSKLNPEKINLIFIGRMHPDKGIHLLIEALKSFKKQFELTLVTIPFQDELNYLEKTKSSYFDLGFDNWFENLPQTEVAEKLKNADLLVLPSTKNEAAPLVILEAFAQKIPVLASDYIAMKDMIKQNFNGLIFKNNDVDSLKEQLQKLINNPNILVDLSKNITTPRTFMEVAFEMSEIYNTMFT